MSMGVFTHRLPPLGAIAQGARGFVNAGSHQVQLLAEGRLPEITTFIQRHGRAETSVVPSYNRFNADGTAHPYYFLSNFYDHPITYKGTKYHTSEHAFQAHKFESSPVFKKIQKDILSDNNPRQAQLKAWDWSKNRCYDANGNWVGKNRGIDHTDADWHKFSQPHPSGLLGKKDLVMEEVLEAKFSKGPLRQQLTNTGDSLIIEDSPHDEVWAIGKLGNGENRLGYAQMKLRARLQAEDAQNGARAMRNTRLPASTSRIRTATTANGYNAADYNQAAQGLSDGLYHQEFLKQRAIHPNSRRDAHIAASKKLGIDYTDENGTVHYKHKAPTSSRTATASFARNRNSTGYAAVTRTRMTNAGGAASHNPGTQGLSQQKIARYNKVFDDNFKTKNLTDSHLAASKALGISYIKNGQTIYQPNNAIASWSQNWFSLTSWISWFKSFFA